MVLIYWITLLLKDNVLQMMWGKDIRCRSTWTFLRLIKWEERILKIVKNVKDTTFINTKIIYYVLLIKKEYNFNIYIRSL